MNKIDILKNNISILFLIMFIFFLDRYSKILVLDNLSENNFYLNDFLNLNLIWNTGIGFGILNSTSPLIYNLTSLLIFLVILFLIYYLFTSDKYEKFIFSLIIGGALGNFYDRLIYKAVPDFIDLHYENFHWFTFNLADIFITVGIFIYLLKGLLVKN